MSGRGKSKQFLSNGYKDATVPQPFRNRSVTVAATVPQPSPQPLRLSEAQEGAGKAVPDFWYGFAKKPASRASC